MEEWKEYKIGDIFEVARGGSPRPIKSYLTDEPDGLNWIKISDATASGKYITETVQKIRPEGLKKSRLVRKGDFILSNSMSFGRPYIMGIDGCIHDGWLVLKDKKVIEVDKDYLYYLLGSGTIYEQFNKLAAGSTVRNLNIGLVRSVSIPLPPLPEQRHLVTLLDRAFADIERARALLERNLRNAEELFQSKLNRVFENEKEVKATKPLGEICENLDRMRVPITKSKRIAGEIPYYGASGIVDHVKDFLFDESLLLVSEDGANLLARTYPIAFSIEGKNWVNNHAHVLRFKNGMLQKYVETYLNSIPLDDFISGMAQPKLNQKKLNSIPIPILNDVEGTMQMIDNIEKEIKAIQSYYTTQLHHLTTLKQSLLQRAFAGKL